MSAPPPPPPSAPKQGDQDKSASSKQEQEDKVENLYGERILHIYLEESFGLTTGKEGDSIDAIIEVKTYDQKKYTSVQKEVTSSSQSYWGQHFFFEKDFRDKYELETELIEVRVYDHNTIGSNSLIGFFTFNQEMVYASENHCMLFKYYPLLTTGSSSKTSRNSTGSTPSAKAPTRSCSLPKSRSRNSKSRSESSAQSESSRWTSRSSAPAPQTRT